MELPVELFNYDLPKNLIAQYPMKQRDASRMLVLDRRTGKCEILPFTAIVDYLQPEDGLIFNNTRVISARLFGRKNGIPDGAKIEILLLRTLDPDKKRWQALLKPGKRAQPGTKLQLIPRTPGTNPKPVWCAVNKKSDDGSYTLEFDNLDITRLQAEFGHVPLPPYIRRDDEIDDIERYQTIFAATPGAVAAPTAGLHFTPEVLQQIQNKGVATAAVTLHVGPGTFKPVSVPDAAQHRMHSENFVLPSKTADMINRTHDAGGKILAVGTTTVRVLESCCNEHGAVVPRAGDTDIFLYPPYRVKSVDMLLTNFHLPKSTLLMLVCTFARRQHVLAAYELAKKEKMRFYSYGDCMLLK